MYVTHVCNVTYVESYTYVCNLSKVTRMYVTMVLPRAVFKTPLPVRVFAIPTQLKTKVTYIRVTLDKSYITYMLKTQVT